MNYRALRNTVFGLGFLAHTLAYAFEPFVIEDIRLKGLERISEGTVLNYLPLNVGDVLSETDTPSVTNALFKTGFFSDVRLERQGHVLWVILKERPAIGKISLIGNDDIKTEELLKGLKAAGLVEGRTFNQAVLDQVQQELQRQYFSRGKYAVVIETTTKEESNNRIFVQITIHEGEAAKIRDIHIIGNRLFSERKLRSQMQLSTSHWWSWFTKDDQYAKQKLVGDRESIRSFYLDKGYLNFNIDSTQVAITPDKKDIFITLNLTEGDVYTVSDIQLRGNFIVPESELKALLSIHPGELFSRANLTDSVTALNDRLGNDGYAFAQVDVDPVLDKNKKTVSLVLNIDPGKRYYARRVIFSGNIKTQDQVLRREVSQLEGTWVSSKRIKDSQVRLDKTGYFSEVQVDVQPVAGSVDQVDIVYAVKEAPSGQLSGGLGFSDVDGLLFQASASNRNFLGTGNNLGFVFNNSRSSTTYSVDYLNPYYTSNGVSRGFSVFYNKTDLSNTTSIAKYATDNWGGNLEYGIPLSNISRFNLGMGYNSTHLLVNKSLAPNNILSFIAQHGDRYEEFTASTSYTYNSFNKYTFPEKGARYSAGIVTSLPGAHLEYYKLSTEFQGFSPIGQGFIATAHWNLGFGHGYGKTAALPFYKNYFSGGARSVRGYAENSLGPKDALGDPFGGDLKIEGSTGVVIPNFFASDLKSVRTQWFVDAGQVYDTTRSQINPDGLRYSTGLSLTWISPLAPLVFSYAIPLNQKTGDRVQRFNFSFATYF